METSRTANSLTKHRQYMLQRFSGLNYVAEQIVEDSYLFWL